ncbi:hypothetical protein CC86DRAFT_117733 [Ophiobolus disseminans]|uniref:Ankyrin n=1 Tax=Ophiobolus disseminans TaxID=1469910 RepID=A0A6A6ZGC4_9PLEO|nr:hypothetical protein CC86DRAFT_117733 [Ophiobolus disseminans]
MATHQTSKEASDPPHDDATLDPSDFRPNVGGYRSLLLAHGASVIPTCTEWDIDCLHRAFAFDDGQQVQAISSLIAAGAKLDSMTRDVTPFPHYPFLLPPGTPLHWAVTTGSHTVIESLVEHGVDVLARDGYDIYVFDDRIRLLDKFGGPNMEVYSISDRSVKGLSPLDYAAMAHDPFIFELLLRRKTTVDVNDVDEEGLSVIHRLSTHPRRRTRTGNAFDDFILRGASSNECNGLKRAVNAILELGGDLELLTTPASTTSTSTDTAWALPCYTPLM